jgi:hypothetical protein
MIEDVSRASRVDSRGDVQIILVLNTEKGIAALLVSEFRWAAAGGQQSVGAQARRDIASRTTSLTCCGFWTTYTLPRVTSAIC